MRSNLQRDLTPARYPQDQKLKILNIENEGESHDIAENKGSIFISHDVTDK